jgi:hypothetical protein
MLSRMYEDLEVVVEEFRSWSPEAPVAGDARENDNGEVVGVGKGRFWET